MTEKALHRDVIKYLNAVLPRTVRAFTVPNDGARGQPGLSRGVPDICLLKQGGHAAFIELKFGKGRLTADQVHWLDWMVANGFEAAVCRSIDDVRALLKAWNVETREVDR